MRSCSGLRLAEPDPRVLVSRLYHDDMYRFGELAQSYWEATPGDVELRAEPLARDDICDVAVIGGGYTGLSAALHLARDHDIDVRVLEAGQIGWGASGRNGGFCSIGGSKMDAREMLRRFGQQETRRYYQTQVQAIDLVRELIGGECIDTPLQGDSELEVAWSKRTFERLAQDAAERSRTLGLDISAIGAQQFREQYFDCTEQFGAVVTKPTFGLHPVKFVRGLAAAAMKHGATVHPHSEVTSWSRQGAEHQLGCAGGLLRAKTVIMAGNGFMPETLHPAFAGRPLPMLSGIVVTRPLTRAELALHSWQTPCPAITSRNLLNYFRLLPDGRFMFGGRGHSSGSERGDAAAYRRLESRLRSLWPEWSQVDVEYRWNGLICMTSRRTPSVGQLPDDPSVFFAFGYHGNGVNTSVWSGKQLADWIGAGGNARFAERLPVMMRGLSGRFPLPALRRYYLQARIALYRLYEPG